MLKGKRITLRSIEIEDLQNIHNWQNDLDILKLTLGIRFPKSRELVLDWINMILKDKSNKNIYFGIEENDTSELIGLVQLLNIDFISKTSEFGIVIGNKDKQGKGFASEAMDLLFGYAFLQLNIRKINLKVIKYNDNAIRLYEKKGFKLCGELQEEIYYENSYHNVLIYSLFKEQFYK